MFYLLALQEGSKELFWHLCRDGAAETASTYFVSNDKRLPTKGKRYSFINSASELGPHISCGFEDII